MLSFTEENYLKAIFTLSENSNASTNAIAKKLNTSAASVSDMAKKLKQKGLINYTKYQPLTLSKSGEKIAISVIRKHRLWECFLVNKLNFNWDEVHDIAEQLEHIKSEELTNRLEEHLEYPSFDPHGDPIPNKEGTFPKRKDLMLNECENNITTEIIGVTNHSTEFYNYLKSKNINIGSTIEIENVNSFDNSFEINIDKSFKTFISNEVAKNLILKTK